MTTKPKAYFDALSQWAESDAPTIYPERGLHGADARAASRALLLEATEDDPEGRAAVLRALSPEPANA
jgi:hypothetical protein